MKTVFYFLIIQLLIFTTLPVYGLEKSEILFIGHAYGQPEYEDEKMDPSVISFLEKYSTEKYQHIIWGGDFIDDCSNINEIDNFIKSIPKEVFAKSIFLWGNHEFECYDNEKFNFIREFENKSFRINEFDVFILNTNFENIVNFDSLSNRINSSKNKILFTHQVIFSKTNWMLRTNSRDYYDLANEFYDKLNVNNSLTIVTGDIGAIRGTPYLSYSQVNGSNLLSSGLGNGKRNYAIEIEIDSSNLRFKKLNLNNNESTTLKPNYLFITIYNFIFYFFLSKKRGVLFLIFIGFIILIINKKKFKNYFIRFKK